MNETLQRWSGSAILDAEDPKLWARENMEQPTQYLSPEHELKNQPSITERVEAAWQGYLKRMDDAETTHTALGLLRGGEGFLHGLAEIGHITEAEFKDRQRRLYCSWHNRSESLS